MDGTMLPDLPAGPFAVATAADATTPNRRRNAVPGASAADSLEHRGTTPSVPIADDDGGGLDVPGGDAFAPLTDADRAAAAAAPAASNVRAGDDADTMERHPCPEPNPSPHQFKHRRHGEPSGVWLYRDAVGAPIAAAARYDCTGPDGTPCVRRQGKPIRRRHQEPIHPA